MAVLKSFIFTATEVVSDFGYPGVLGLLDVSKVVLDLVQYQARRWYSINSCRTMTFYEPSQVASTGLEVVFLQRTGP